MRPRDLALLVTTGAIWGASFMFIEVALRDFAPLTIVAGRLAVGAIVLAPWATRSRGGVKLSLKLIGVFFVVGALNGLVPQALITAGQQSIDSSLAGILNAAMPVFTIVLARFVLPAEERLSTERIAGSIVGVAGVAVLLGGDALAGAGRVLLAKLAVVGAALSYAVATVLNRRLLADVPTNLSAAGTLATSALIAVPLSVVVDAPWPVQPSASSVTSVAALGILASAVAYVLYYRLLHSAGPTNASLVTFLIPVSSVIWGAALLGERIEMQSIVGLALIMIGVAGVTEQLSRWRRGARRVSPPRSRRRAPPTPR